MLWFSDIEREIRGQARRWAVGAGAGLAIATFASGCTFRSDDGCFDCYEPHLEPYLATVDADVSLTTDLGEGAGIFVEYHRGGLWNLWTSCDTLRHGYSCYWDIYVTSYGVIDWAAGYDHEPYDAVDVHDDHFVSFHFETAYGSDGVELQATPGELLEIEAYLDGVYRGTHDYFVWYGNDRLNEGAPRQPITFLPDAP